MKTSGCVGLPNWCLPEPLKFKIMNKADIITDLQNVNHHFSSTCNAIEEAAFFEKPGNKWSVAENVQHLVLSVSTTTLAFQLPKLLVRLIGGKPNRPSGSFEELKAKYYCKLDEGAKASSRYVPKPILHRAGKEKLLDKWNKVNSKLIYVLTHNNSEQELDVYLVKHPLLGRITLRELCYFTVFHTQHHLNSIAKTHAAEKS